MDLHPSYPTQRLALTGDARYPALLTRLAGMLPKYGLNSVALELMNEPISPLGDGCNPAFDYTPWQQKFYSAARAGSPDLTLILTGACWGGVDGLLRVTPINDPQVIYSIHNYDPMTFTHQGADWTGWNLMYTRNMPYPPTPQKVAAALPGVLYRVPTAPLREQLQSHLVSYGSSGAGPAQMLATLGRAAEWGKQHHARLLLGEFGVLQTVAPPQDRVQWIKDMRQSAEQLNIPQALWDYNPAGGFGPFRGGQLERGVLEALGLTVPVGAVATPPNPVDTQVYPRNPVSAPGLLLADFNGGSQSNFGAATGYYGYGKPQMPTLTPSSDGRVPSSGGQLQYGYDLPQNDDYAGVSAVINLKPRRGHRHHALQPSPARYRIDTPTDESVGFLSNAWARNPYVDAQRACPAQNVDSRVMVSVHGVSTTPAHETRLTDPVCFLGMPALRTSLRSVAGVNGNYSLSGAFCLESEYLKELTPPNIMDTAGQIPASHPTNVEIFVCNQVVFIDQFAGFFVVKIQTLTCHLAVQLRYSLDCLSAGVAALVRFAGNGTLRDSEFLHGVLKVPGVVHKLAIGGD